MTRLEHAVAEEWTPDAITTAGVSDLVVQAIRHGRLTPEEGLLAAIFPPDVVREAGHRHAIENLGLRPYAVREATPEPTLTPEERQARQRAREHHRYHNDPEYRARRLGQMKERRSTPEYRAREAARKRRARARRA
jgi:hypothetical protein